MAKKKQKKEEIEEDLDEGLFGDDSLDDIGIVDSEEFMGEGEGPAIPADFKVPDEKLDVERRLKRKLSEELEETQENYKHLQVNIISLGKNEYMVIIRHQGHGFLNYFTSKILKIKGVEYAAYKVTNLDHPRIYIHTDGSKEIKNILKEAVKKMKIELKGLRNAVGSMKL